MAWRGILTSSLVLLTAASADECPDCTVFWNSADPHFRPAPSRVLEKKEFSQITSIHFRRTDPQGKTADLLFDLDHRLGRSFKKISFDGAEACEFAGDEKAYLHWKDLLPGLRVSNHAGRRLGPFTLKIDREKPAHEPLLFLETNSATEKELIALADQELAEKCPSVAKGSLFVDKEDFMHVRSLTFILGKSMSATRVKLALTHHAREATWRKEERPNAFGVFQVSCEQRIDPREDYRLARDLMNGERPKRFIARESDEEPIRLEIDFFLRSASYTVQGPADDDHPRLGGFEKLVEKAKAARSRPCGRAR
jgi:hypothetical protein